jgi:hypothetical protein
MQIFHATILLSLGAGPKKLQPIAKNMVYTQNLASLDRANY